LQSLKGYHSDLYKNIRSDLSSDAYFYARVQNALAERGKHIEELGQMIKNVFVIPLQELTAKLKQYNDKIDELVDPKNTFDRFMNALPTAEEFGDIAKFAISASGSGGSGDVPSVNGDKGKDGGGDEAVEALKAAYQVAVRAVNYIADELFISDEMKKRDDLYREIKELRERYKQKMEEYNQQIEEYNKIKSLVIILRGMQFFCNESEPIITALDGVYTKLIAATQSPDAKAYKAALAELEK